MQDVLIIGAGLTGLSLAHRFETMDLSCQVIEARDRTGGRIHGHRDPGGAVYDLGPAWFWPINERMTNLVSETGLPVFEQYSTGDLMFEERSGRVQRGVGFASMQGSLRLDGGMPALIDAVQSRLKTTGIDFGVTVAGLTRETDHVLVATTSAERYRAKRVVLALPPRLAASSISFAPALTPEIKRTLLDVPTWMAGQAKLLALYEEPFWRSKGLSGDASSMRGPLVEIHDASPASGGPFALFGFVGTPPDMRRAHKDDFELAVKDQLARLFGEAARTTIKLITEDWAFQLPTSTKEDRQPLKGHPDQYGLPPHAQYLWNDRLILCSTETAIGAGGYLEGAIEAAEMVINRWHSLA